MDNHVRIFQGAILTCFIGYYTWIGFAVSGAGGKILVSAVSEYVFYSLICLLAFIALFYILGHLLPKLSSIRIISAGLCGLILVTLSNAYPKLFFDSNIFISATILSYALIIYSVDEIFSHRQERFTSRSGIVVLVVLTLGIAIIIHVYEPFIASYIFQKNTDTSMNQIEIAHVSDSVLTTQQGNSVGVVVQYQLKSYQDRVFEDVRMIGGLGTGRGTLTQDFNTDKFNQEHEDDLNLVHYEISPRVEVGEVFKKNTNYRVTLYAIPAYVGKNSFGKLELYEFTLSERFVNETLSSLQDTCIYWTNSKSRNPPIEEKSYTVSFSHSKPLSTAGFYSAQKFYQGLRTEGVSFCDR